MFPEDGDSTYKIIRCGPLGVCVRHSHLECNISLCLLEDCSGSRELYHRSTSLNSLS